MPGKPDNRPGDYRLKQSSKVVNCGSYCTGRVCRHARPHIELARPAKAEPCGMVISEAIAAQVPVVVSDACGAAAQVTEDAGEVVPLTAPLDKWVRAITINLIALKPRRSLCAEGIALRENSPPYMKL